VGFGLFATHKFYGFSGRTKTNPVFHRTRPLYITSLLIPYVLPPCFLF
jgi:hypothetical protein